MNCAEFKTIRETLGLTVQTVADELGVDKRTATKWELDTQPSAKAVTWILSKWQIRMEQLQRVLDQLAAFEDEYGEPDTVELTRYASRVSAERSGVTLDELNATASTVGQIALLCELFDYPWSVKWVRVEGQA